VSTVFVHFPKNKCNFLHKNCERKKKLQLCPIRHRAVPYEEFLSWGSRHHCPREAGAYATGSVMGVIARIVGIGLCRRQGLCNGTMSVRPSVRLTVCLSRLSTAAAACGGFAAVGPAGRRYRSIAARPTPPQQRRRSSTAVSSKGEQCHAVGGRFANAAAASYWSRRVLENAGAETRRVHRARGAGGEAFNAPLACKAKAVFCYSVNDDCTSTQMS